VPRITQTFVNSLRTCFHSHDVVVMHKTQSDFDRTNMSSGASIPMGQGGHVPPIFVPGGHDHECPPPNISRVISATFYPCNILLIS